MRHYACSSKAARTPGSHKVSSSFLHCWRRDMAMATTRMTLVLVLDPRSHVAFFTAVSTGTQTSVLYATLHAGARVPQISPPRKFSTILCGLI